ncbi:unnamed protein product [Alopecurus aequalis]
MGHDGAHHKPASRDAKKKKGNRSSAKLKQCKLDARREQWLSQVKDGKEATATALPAAAGSGKGSNAGSPILASPHPPLPRRRGDAGSRDGAPEDDKEDAGAIGQDLGSSDFDSPMPSPSSDNSRGGGCAQRKRCSSNGGGPSLSSVSSLWSSSRSVSDAEDDDTGSGPDEENGVLDDWEAVADALSVDDNSHCHQSLGSMMPPAAPRGSAPMANAAKRTVRSNARAWTPDDMFRPQSLPSISKHTSFPVSSGNCWGRGMGAAHQSILPSPLSCPICCEDLDPTDSSFLPCPCGFHLCLFCHKRILEADARCPGCRKQYNAVSAAGAGGGATAPVRLSRSCSMGPRH